ncbi:hypothetical protein [Winogradskyella ursingii]|uniref:hypothetical protein n=1 Tax=Winogradskyella ursingii TaxID=2686079 RepID=UPI0015CAF974|nr:hypothetical protein [Winogradskyella ursingii]
MASVSKYKFSITLVLIIIIQIILMFQGFDVCDDGFVLTFYQQIYSHPTSVEYNFLYWFSGIFGGLWHMLNEDGGVLWFRILGVIVNTSTFVISYNILKKHIASTYLLLALVMVMFVNDYGFLTFYHNHLTALLTVIIVWCILYGLKKKVLSYFFIAGFIFVFNGLTRLPNFVMACLFLVIPFYYFLKDKNLKKSIKPLVLSIVGFATGLVSAYLLLLVLGQLKTMENALLTMIDVGNTEGSSHNFKTLLKAQFQNYLNIALDLLQVIVVFFVAILGLRLIRKQAVLRYLFLIAFGIIIMIWFDKNGIYAVYALAYVGSIYIIVNKNFTIELRAISFLAFMMLLGMTIGSAGGILNTGYIAIWIALPLFFIAFQDILSRSKQLFSNNSDTTFQTSSLILCTLSISFLILKSYRIFNQAYFDEGSRLQKTYAINNNMANHIYTTERRAQIINDLLNNLEKYVDKDDYLFAYDHMPMLHYLTETRPYIYNPWPGIYDDYSLENKIKKAEKEISVMPTVVVQKFNTIIRFSEPIEDYMIPEKNNEVLHGSKSIALMNSFLQRNNYRIVWSNSYFNIYQSYEVR